MKLNEVVYDHDHYSLLQKVAKELGYQQLQLHDSTYYVDDDNPDHPHHYDGAPDIDTAIHIARMTSIEDKASAYNALDRLSNLRSMDVDDMAAPKRALNGPLSRLRGVAELAKAYEQVEAQQDWVRVSANNVKKVLMLINGIKSWANREAERGSDDSYKITVAKTTLKKLGVPQDPAS